MGTAKRKVFSIKDGILKLALEDVWSLKLHERVIPEFIASLKKSILDDGVVKDPVLVDEKTLVILDGMHRVVALRELGYAYIPCCLIDYQLPTVHLGAWYRVITGGATFSQMADMARLSYDTLKLSEAHSCGVDRMIGENKGICALRTSDSAWLFSVDGKLNCREAYDIIYLIEERLRSANLKISYQTESDADTIVLNDKSAACLVVPTLTKKDVLRYALKGEVFAPKATRHVFPFRMLGLNVPIELLDGKKLNLEEANKRLRATISRRRLARLPGGQLVNGRRYEEPIYLLKK